MTTKYSNLNGKNELKFVELYIKEVNTLLNIPNNKNQLTCALCCVKLYLNLSHLFHNLRYVFNTIYIKLLMFG